MKVSVLKGFAGLGVRLAVLSVFLLGMAGIAQAQASGAAPQANPKSASAATSQLRTEPATVAPGKRAPKGNHEGIKVHGHWTIEVKNPDGTVVTHREFENALVQPGGAQDLTAILSGNYVPGGYIIDLGSPNGPCAPLQPNSQDTDCFLVGSLVSPTPATFADTTQGCGGSFSDAISPTGPCFPLSVTTTSTTGLAFSGTAVAANPATITVVNLGPLVCQSTTQPPKAPGVSTATISSNACAEGQGQVGGWSFLTHAALATPVQITSAGQLISVNVQISFQ